MGVTCMYTFFQCKMRELFYGYAQMNRVGMFKNTTSLSLVEDAGPFGESVL